MRWLQRLPGAAPADVPARRASYISPDEVACATAAIDLFVPGSRPTVTAYRHRLRWTDCAAQPATRETLAQIAATGACEVRVRWRSKVQHLRLPLADRLPG